MRNDTYLFDIKLTPKNFSPVKMGTPTKFPILKNYLKITNDYYYLLLIEIEKVNNLQGNLAKQNLNSNYHQFYSTYQSLLPIFNSELLDLFCKINTTFSPEAIILPQSSREYLREGLENTFTKKFPQAHIVYATKNYSAELSSGSRLPPNFQFIIDSSKRGLNSYLILDDCKSSGRTIELIKKELNPSADVKEAFYLKNSK